MLLAFVIIRVVSYITATPLTLVKFTGFPVSCNTQSVLSSVSAVPAPQDIPSPQE